MSFPGNPLEVTSVQSEVNARCGIRLSSPLRLQEASPSPRSPGSSVPPKTKRLKCWGGMENALACRAWDQPGYVRPELATLRWLPEEPRAAG